MLSGFDFKFYLSILWRRLPLVLFIWIAIASAGIYAAFKLPPVYQANATILVESPKIPTDLATSTVSVSSDEVIQVIKQRLTTRDNLLRLSEKFNVFASDQGLSPTERVELMRAAAEVNVISLGVAGQNAATTFSVAFRSSDPVVAAQVANEMVTVILNENVQLRTDRATQTTEFFREEVGRLSEELGRIEGQIVSFKSENSDSLPDSLEFRRNEISRIQVRLVQLDSQELTLREQANIYRRALENPNVATPLPDAVASPLELQLADLRRQLAQRSAILSETHPQIVALQSEIASLEASIVEARRNSAQAIRNTENAADETRAPGQIESTLLQLEASIRFIGQQRDALERQLEQIMASIEDTPTTEMSLNILERQHQAVQSQYGVAVASLSAAATGETIETSQQGERFELIEPAVVPERPVSPNRKMIAAMGMAAGLGAGLGLLVLLEMLNTSVRRPVDLEEKLGIRPFATVPYIETKGEVFRGRMKQLGWISVIVFGLPAAAYVVHYQVMPIDLLVEKVLTRVGLEKFTL